MKKVTGYELREAIKTRQLKLSNLERDFSKSMFAFEDQKKEKPQELAKRIFLLERDIVRLQTAQAEYNLAATCVLPDGAISLAEAIKLQGVVGRLLNRWQAYQHQDLDGGGEMMRVKRADVQEEHAKPQMSNKDVLDQVLKIEAQATAIKAAIAKANSEELPVKALTDLFEL
jgi:hypothetical protein